MIPGITAGFPAGGSPSGDPVADWVASLSTAPVFWCRHRELSGTTMENEVGADGVYQPSYTLGQPALNPSGTTSVEFTDTNGQGTLPGTIMPGGTVPAITLLTILKPIEMSGSRPIICRDSDFGNRVFQFTQNGTDLRWVKIVGGVAVVDIPSGLVANTPVPVGVRVKADGTVSMYVGTSQIGSDQMIAPADYGLSDTPGVFINGRELGESRDAGYADSMGFDYALSDPQMAAGLAAMSS